jgi:hypothetical protein
LEQEVAGEPLSVSSHSLGKNTRRHAVEGSKDGELTRWTARCHRVSLDELPEGRKCIPGLTQRTACAGEPRPAYLVIGMVVFGGLGTLWGPVLGALLLYGLYEGLRFVGVVYNLVAVGFVIMVFVIFFPRGLAGFGRSA